jgi:hypothetical protein
LGGEITTQKHVKKRKFMKASPRVGGKKFNGPAGPIEWLCFQFLNVVEEDCAERSTQVLGTSKWRNISGMQRETLRNTKTARNSWSPGCCLLILNS